MSALDGSPNSIAHKQPVYVEAEQFSHFITDLCHDKHVNETMTTVVYVVPVAFHCNQ